MNEEEETRHEKRKAAAEWARQHGLTAELYQLITSAIVCGELDLGIFREGEQCVTSVDEIEVKAGSLN
jgi:hypothetical protein